jgi:hypothetical protein
MKAGDEDDNNNNNKAKKPLMNLTPFALHKILDGSITVILGSNSARR